MPDERRRGYFRSVHAALIDNPGWQELAPDARLTFLTQRLCESYGVAGIWRFYLPVIAAQTGLKEAKVRAALEELQAAAPTPWVRVDWKAGVLWLVNGLRYDPQVTITNTRHLSSILGQLRSLPSTTLCEEFLRYYGIDGNGHTKPAADTLSDAPYSNGEAIRLNKESPLARVEATARATADSVAPRPAPPSRARAEGGTQSALDTLLEAATAAASDRERTTAERRELNEAVFNAWAQSLQLAMEKRAPGAGRITAYLIGRFEQLIEQHYAETGGAFSPARRRNFARRMARFDPEAQLAGLEIQIDDKGARKPEVYALGIAERLARLDETELARAIDEHRTKHQDRGVFAEATTGVH